MCGRGDEKGHEAGSSRVMRVPYERKELGYEMEIRAKECQRCGNQSSQKRASQEAEGEVGVTSIL